MILFIFEGDEREPRLYRTMERLYFPTHYLHILDNQAPCTLIGTDEISTFSQTSSECSIP